MPHLTISTGSLIGYGVVMGGLTLFGLAANAAVVAIVLGDRHMRRSSMNLLLMNLAVCDFLINLYFIQLLGKAVFARMDASELPSFFPDASCPLLVFFSTAVWSAAIITFMAIAIERYIVVLHPLHAALVDWRRMVRAIAAIWVFSILYKTPQLFIFRVTTPQVKEANITSTSRICEDINMGTKSWYIYEWSQILQHFIIPILIGVVLYSRVCMTLWRVDGRIYGGEREINRKQEEELAKRKSAVLMVIASISLFFLCYAPKAINDLVYVTTKISLDFQHSELLPDEVGLVVQTLFLVSSSLNPLIYALFSTKFRTRMCEVFCLKFRSDESNGCTRITETVGKQNEGTL